MKQRNWQCDITPAVEELGFSPEYDLERGVKETIAWYLLWWEMVKRLSGSLWQQVL